jgi:hypothetical protein
VGVLVMQLLSRCIKSPKNKARSLENQAGVGGSVPASTNMLRIWVLGRGLCQCGSGFVHDASLAFWKPGPDAWHTSSSPRYLRVSICPSLSVTTTSKVPRRAVTADRRAPV